MQIPLMRVNHVMLVAYRAVRADQLPVQVAIVITIYTTPPAFQLVHQTPLYNPLCVLTVPQIVTLARPQRHFA